MPASEIGVGERTLNFATAGAGAGAITGIVNGAFSKPVVGESTMALVGGQAIRNAGVFAGIAGVFAATDTLLDQTVGHNSVNSAAAGCAAGAIAGARFGGDPMKMMFGCLVFGSLQGIGMCRSHSDTMRETA